MSDNTEHQNQQYAVRNARSFSTFPLELYTQPFEEFWNNHLLLNPVDDFYHLETLPTVTETTGHITPDFSNGLGKKKLNYNSTLFYNTESN